jgi:hypothetical protein
VFGHPSPLFGGQRNGVARGFDRRGRTHGRHQQSGQQSDLQTLNNPVPQAVAHMPFLDPQRPSEYSTG